ncbi:hypothetical protein [Marinobacter maritimus]|uniref:hypothetical protein n=1 Tax=Marinobacter maritimus TaxID=277961 RepID=UPI001FE910CE|nr:hypothetical protein [Marinobacter maritimus]
MGDALRKKVFTFSRNECSRSPEYAADALRRSKSTYQRRRISFSVHEFHQLVQQIEAMAKAGAEIKPEDFYPEVKKHRGKSRDLPMNDVALRTAIKNYLSIRLATHPSVKKTDPLFLTQKGGPYSPNTLQEHLALMQSVVVN